MRTSPLVPALLALASTAAPARADVGQALARLGAPDAAAVHAARAELAGDPVAARAALEGFAARPPLERRERARLVAAALPAADVGAALELLADPDPRVRAALCPLLARPDLGADLPGALALGARITRLAALAGEDPDAEVRAAAREALGELDSAAAAEALARLARRGRPGERADAAARLAPTPRGAPAIRALVRDGLRLDVPAGERTTPISAEVLARALELHGRLLADGTPSAADRAELLVALRHPDARVRAAAARGFDAFLTRVAEFAEPGAATRLLEQLERAGLDPRVAAFNRARLSLFPACDAEAALDAAARVRAGGAASDERDPDTARLWRYRSFQLEAAAELAAGRPGDAARAAAGAAAVLDALLAERQDLGSTSDRRRHAEALAGRALVEVTALLADLADGADASSPASLARARAAHALQLEAQVLAAELDGQSLGSWDALLDDELSPYRLLFHGRAYDALPLRRLIELQRALGRALATVSPREVPGFRPFEGPGGAPLEPELTDPLADPRRADLLERIQSARVDGARRELERVEEELARERDRGSLVVPEELLEESEFADLRVRLALRDQQEARDGRVLELRVPSSLGLWLARDLAADGRPQEARIVAGRVRQDIERVGISRWWFYLGHERVVRALMQVGAAFTDEGDAARAEAALLEAVERLEDVERQLEEQGATARDLESFRQMRAAALVSLAVNANVRMGRPEKALAYYERAYAIRQDEFMTALLACYRARSDRADEARTLLRRVRPGPQTWYNLACAHALLGDTQEALDLLERELRDNHPSEGSRRRQQAWARGDPDLARLRGDPRFERLTTPE